MTSKTHLRDLLQDEERNAALRQQIGDGIMLDYTHTKIDLEGLRLLNAVASEQRVAQNIQSMFAGEVVNPTEGRQVWHVKLRTQQAESDIEREVLAVQESIKAFSEKIRTGSLVGYTGKAIKNVISIGIGGSYLGPEFVFEALKFYSNAHTSAQGRKLKFLANVDPIDI